jgi:Ca2+-binding RTX toxin-like protein
MAEYLGTSGDDSLLGGAGNDDLLGAGGDDYLHGGGGDDWLYGDMGADRLEGAGGDDYLHGGDGVDVAIFSGQFSDYRVHYISSNGRYLVADQAGGRDGHDVVSAIELLQFTDRIVAPQDALFVLTGTAGDDSLYGGKTDDLIVGGQGNDYLDGGNGGSDTAIFTGNANEYTVTEAGTDGYLVADKVGGRDGTDRLSTITWLRFADATVTPVDALSPVAIAGTAGADTLHGSVSPDSIAGLAGDDWLYGHGANDTLTGAAGSDYLIGDAGDDVLEGGAGDDVLQGVFGDDVAVFSGNFSDYLITYENGPYRVVDLVSGRDGTDHLYDVGQVRFADRTSAIDDALTPASITGTSHGDNLSGTGAGDSISALDDDDSLYGWAGNDLLNGGAGRDFLSGGNGNDSLVGGTGNDEIDGGAGDDTLTLSGEFSEYSVASEPGQRLLIVDSAWGRDGIERAWDVEFFRFANGLLTKAQLLADVGISSSGTSGLQAGTSRNDYLYGSKGADTLLGGAGNDWLHAGDDGHDSINGGSGNDSLSAGSGNDTVEGGEGGDSVDGGSGDDVAVLSGARSQYQATVVDGMLKLIHAQEGTDWYANVETYRFSDGTVTAAQLTASGTPGDAHYGTDGADSLSGGSGDDSLYGGKGNDVLTGGADQDLLDGEGGSDTAAWSGPRADYTVAYDEAAGRYVVIDGVAGRDGTDAVSNVEFLRFADGTRAVGAAGIDGLLRTGTNSTDTLQGGSGSDSLYGGKGTDGLSGQAGDDYLQGEEDADALDGGAGADRLLGNEGKDTLTGGSGDDSLDGGSGTDIAVYSGARGGYTIVNASTGATVSSSAEGADTLTGVERLRFSDSAVALDLDGNAGQVARLIGAVLGAEAVANPSFVRIGLAQVDAGVSSDTLMPIALSYALGPTYSNEAVVALLFTNLFGSPPTAAQMAPYVSLLQTQQLTPAGLASIAAQSSYNDASIELTGLKASGLVYALG